MLVLVLLEFRLRFTSDDALLPRERDGCDPDDDARLVIADEESPVRGEGDGRGACGPCRMVAPELERIARDRPGRLVVAKVDTEALPDVASRFGIRSIPTMVLMRGGREAQRVMGAMPASAIAARLSL